jgi:hypothetical protein
MTQMTAMTTPPCEIDPFDPYLHHGYDCYALNNNTNSETPHTISPTSLDMYRKASKNASQGQSVIHGDAHNQIQWHSNRPTTTPIPMDPAVAKPLMHSFTRPDPRHQRAPAKTTKHKNTKKQKQSTNQRISSPLTTIRAN